MTEAWKPGVMVVESESMMTSRKACIEASLMITCMVCVSASTITEGDMHVTNYRVRH
jgi:hypothetical protein